MRLSSSAVALGAASSVLGFQGQQVLYNGNSDQPVIDFESGNIDSWASSVETIFGKLSSEAKGLWDEVSMLMPDAVEAFKKQALGTPPKPATRRPDHHWDHIVKGAEVKKMGVNGVEGSQRMVGGKLENYNLRAKKVDPSSLGVDTVKQYSGYLDDEEEDKHLFYCKLTPHPANVQNLVSDHVQGSSSRAMTPRTTPLSSGSTAAQAARR